MTLLPFSLSYIFMTPGRVRLPGEVAKKSSPTRTSSPPSPPRWSADLASKAKSVRTSMSFRRLSTGTARALKTPNGESDNLLEDSESPASPTSQL